MSDSIPPQLMLEAAGLSKSYREKRVVDGVDLSVPPGSVTGLLGANGAGKTTTLRLMLGLIRGGGETRFLGRPLRDWHCPGQVVGAVFGGVGGHPKHRVIDHLTMVAYGLGLSAPEAAAQAALDRIGLEQARGLRLGQLSLGMTQRVELTQALLGQPQVLVLDEPFNGLDPHSIAWLRSALRSFADAGGAVLLSSHLLAEMEQLADRVVVMVRGRVTAESGVREIAEQAGRHVLVESPAMARLAVMLELAGGRIEALDADHARVTGVSRQQVGLLAADHGIPLYSLGEHSVSIEEFYLSVAEEEFSARWPQH
ncbi:ABC transporter ATP-binding protein [Streptomyces sp. AV19]|uniref:ABC transporter ATP-binding protein n=1 Tax=Streptomyces sp. AV19 TaxID=2793068 RepID=UPI0018FE7E06|nr:ABC transporter ATP-binding protein [Streptomyces sp. AV19]MBH1939073.1 ABC transporter ATP-binding protein [Streptomyces sp. AV19]MDG4534274.1 ABC transporter ATP-binding protein [Streptomyces sp. AV19]